MANNLTLKISVKFILTLTILFISIKGNTQQKNSPLDSQINPSKTERILNGNNFENRISPTTYNFFYPEVNEIVRENL